MFGGCFDANALVGNIARAALYAIVLCGLARRAQRFVVEGGYTEYRAQLRIETAQIRELLCERGDLVVVSGGEKLLVARVPQAADLSVDQMGRKDGHLVAPQAMRRNSAPQPCFPTRITPPVLLTQKPCDDRAFLTSTSSLSVTFRMDADF